MSQNTGYMEMHAHPQMSSVAQPYASHPATAGMPHYQYPQPVMPSGNHYTPAPSYTYGYATNGVASPQSATHPGGPVGSQVSSQSLTLPAMMPAPQNSHAYVPGHAQPQQAYQAPTTFDTTGQVAPPGMKPRVTATLWEDEGTLCFQVEAKGVCVARREDNHFINGTKLLNVAGMTRGRRDGILKSEKTRHVVKIGPMHLKGVWIPFERALDFANKEKITDQLYPLFVHNIGGLLYQPENTNRTSAVVAAAERRRMEGETQGRSSQPPALTHHHSMSGPMPPTPHSIAPSAANVAGRPEMQRSQTFPTPPTSASSVIGMGPNAGSYDWNNSNAPQQPLSVDTGMPHPRSMPTTPATTPPGSSLQGMQSYPGNASYDASKPYYATSSAPQAPNGYAPGPRYSQSAYKSEMGPPSAPGQIGAEHDHHDPNGQVGAPHNPTGHEHETGYMAANNAAYGANRSYAYPHDPAHISPEMTNSPSYQTGSGRGTPRTMPQQWPPGYHTPPRSQTAYATVPEPRSSIGMPSTDAYGATAYPSTGKRGREEDDQDQNHDYDAYDPKRRKLGRAETYGGPLGSTPQMKPIKTGGGMPRQR